MDFYYPPSLQGAIDSLGSVYRALRAWRFYPKGHPVRRSSINQAHASLLAMLDGNDLTLQCGRNGFSFPDGEPLKDSSRMSVALSYELFVRRVQKLTIMHDIFQEDLLDFLRIIALTPEQIQQGGGVDKIMEEHGIRSVWVNEFDFSVIRNKRRRVEAAGRLPQGVDQLEEGDEAELPLDFASTMDESIDPEQELQVLIGRLAATEDESSYMILSRQAVACADQLKTRRQPAAVFPLVELLTAHARDPLRPEPLQEYAGFVLEQLAIGDELISAVFDMMETSQGLSKEALLALLAAGGATAVTRAVEQMAITNNLAVRKTLSTTLGRLGEQAVPILLEMMGDRRWFIIRNLAAILGLIGSREAVPGLIRCLKHSDTRVCKEAIRSLSLIGGSEAETAILDVLRTENTALQPQAIASLGGMKSKKALPDLLRIVMSDDMFLKTLAIKQEALAAIAMIGYPQVTPPLLELLTGRRLVAAVRWRQLKVSIVQCLAKLGDKRCLPVLRKMSSGSGELEKACAEAAEIIERAGSEPHGSR